MLTLTIIEAKWSEKNMLANMVKMPILIKPNANSGSGGKNSALPDKPPAFGLRHKDRYSIHNQKLLKVAADFPTFT